jgi:predicted enzyme related to lactoylglutathione lyase
MTLTSPKPEENTMAKTGILRGLCNISFWAEDVRAATQWYVELLGVEPYFVRPPEGPPQYVEFRLGDQEDELGIIDKKFQPKDAKSGPGGVVAYWHVDDILATLERAKRMGAKEYEPLIEREAGFKTASVVDPFGNVLGLMFSPHFLEKALPKLAK